MFTLASPRDLYINGCLYNMTEPACCIISVNPLYLMASEVGLQLLKHTALIPIAFIIVFHLINLLDFIAPYS